MSLANLLPPLTKSWADEVNDDLEERSLEVNFTTSYYMNTSRLDHYSEIEEAETLPPDFTDYEALGLPDEEHMFDSYPFASNDEMIPNNQSPAVETFPDQILLPNTNTLAKYMTMDIPKTLPYSTSEPNAYESFDTEFEFKRDIEVSRDEDQEETTTITQYSINTWEKSIDDFPDLLDDYNPSIESTPQTTPELGTSFFSELGSHYSSQTEEDGEEFRIDHPLVGKDVVGI
ncbi:hypothetical protein SBOR_9237 [Sclerotinia borealis F-4128]|uniref:Uncharacterized protein n=1 Tax=Sclerotinia borealis (strain F-4128) TaxID=1432307 RepID=W9C753_SCLBF|nr:hypothetical protein SBOR_9237 [Sclerotinia borealis F-4128]